MFQENTKGTEEFDEPRDMLQIPSVLDLVSKEKIKTSVSALSSFHTRHSKSKFINQVADWLKKELETVGYVDVCFHNYNKMGFDLRNVICHKEDKTKDRILLCAHFDSIMEDRDNAEKRSPGADDNASGVSALLEIARVLSDTPLENNVEFAFFSGEEQGQWGSASYASHIKDQNVKIRGLINLDMIGSPPNNQNKVIIERDIGNKVSSNDHPRCYSCANTAGLLVAS